MIILIHSSKSMRAATGGSHGSGRRLTTPALVDKATQLGDYLRGLTVDQIAAAMAVSASLAAKTHETLAAWNADPQRQTPAVESFLGDIYSGLRAADFTGTHRAYATRHLRIISGLYGILRPYDGISPYRLEMAYHLPDPRYANLYTFWADSIAKQLPADGPIVNLTAVEYGKAALVGVSPDRVVAPKFLTIDPATGKPKFIAVHAKIARGAYARWLVTAHATDDIDLTGFDDLGYRHAPELSGPREPCFVCAEFAGTGLSVRLSR